MNPVVLFLALFLAQPVRQEAQVPIAPAHPITQETLQQYFDVCHFALTNRRLIDMQFAAQEKKLPPWYPMDVWRETVDAIDSIDVTTVALPVYQRYFSEQAGRNAIRLFLTPAGQAMVKKAYDDSARYEQKGGSGLDAHLKAIDAAKVDEDAKVRQMMASMSPTERRQTEIFVQSEEWKRLNALGPEIAKEFSAAYLAAQRQVVESVTHKDHDALVKAHREYAAAHPENPDGE